MPAYSFVQYSGDGSTGPFVIPFPYLDPVHVIVRVDTVEAAFSFDSETSISLITAAANGAVVEIRRETLASERLVDFTDGSVLTEVDLDTASLQQLYLAQETFDLADTAITLEADGVYDFAARRATNLADPSAAQDAATKAYVDTTTPASAAAAAASATAAAASATSAASDASASVTAATASATAQTAAETAQTAAEAAAASINGLPSGGAIGQVLTKQSGTDYDVVFQDVAGGVEVVEVASAPDADDDDSDTGGNGTFSLGSQWRDTTSDVLYVCLDASTGAAVWHAFNVQGGLIGEVVAWPAAAIPSGWLECDGAAVSRATYASLFAAIGTAFGVGDGSTTFNLPDLRGEFIRGLDNGRGVDGARVLGSAQSGQLGDHKHEIPFGIEPDSNADLYFENPDVFGEGGAFTADRSVGASGSSTSADYALTNTPYRSSDDEASIETRPRNVALKYIIRAASTYDVADLTPNMPAASEVAAGAIEIATQAEVDGGTETAKTVVPDTLKKTPLPQIAPDVVVEDQKASGTGGGAVNTGYYLTWKKRALNTEVRDALGITLSADEVTLPAGTYYAEAQSPGFGANHFRCRIYDETNAVELGLSDTGYSGTNAQDWAKACAVFTLADAANVSVQYQSNYNGSSTANLGAYGSFSGVPEVYTRLKIWRLA